MDRKQVKTFRMGADECEVLELLGAEGGPGRTEVLRSLGPEKGSRDID